MRIRKNANLSSLIQSNGGSRGKSVYVCKLNQSPWDVIPFAQEPYPPYLHKQFEIEDKDSFNGNVSLVDSVGAVESIASMMEGEGKSIMKVDEMLVDDNDEVKIGKQFEFKNNDNPSCSLTNNKTEKNNNYQPTGNRRGRDRAAKKGSLSTLKPFEFYYYSGFGPSWGRRRGGGGEIEKNDGNVITTENNTMSSSWPQFDNTKEFDYVDDEEDDYDDEGNEDSGKKRKRKPTKARSLKSLR